MRTLVFASRNTKEITRDIFTLIFGILFPLVLLVLLSAINSSIPEGAGMKLFEITNLVPGISVFGLSFISLFTATLVSKDRCTSFILRLFTSPLKSSQYIAGYTLPLIPMSLLQIIVCYIASFAFGLKWSANILLAIVVNLPTTILFIAIGLLCGTVFNDKAVGGVCGALLTNLSAWLSGTWFDLELVGGAFEKIADIIAEKLDIEKDQIKPESSFGDMEVDSLYMVEIMLSIEDEFNVTIEDAADMKTVKDLCDFVEANI